MTTNTYTKLRYPTPPPVHANYPFYTPGGGDKRWIGMPETEESMHWVGPLMYVPSLSTAGVRKYAHVEADVGQFLIPYGVIASLFTALSLRGARVLVHIERCVLSL
jgi:hypothetical protein